MKEQFQPSALAAAARYFSPIAILFPLAAPTAHAKQCNAERPSVSRAHWSYRLIDGRKCWYEGENGLSKSSLQWSADAPSSPSISPLSLSPQQPTQAVRPVPWSKSSTSGTSSGSPAPAVPEQAPIRILRTRPSNTLQLNETQDFEERWRALEASGK